MSIKQTVIQTASPNSNVLPAPTVIRHYETAPSAPETSAKAPEGSAPTEAPSPASEPVAEAKRAERRDALKRAAAMEAKARQQMQAAKALAAEGNQIKALLEQAKTDPTALARAAGLSTDEYLRRLNNHVLQIPDEPKLTNDQAIAQRLEHYERELQQERTERLKEKANSVKQHYVATKILPAVSKDRFPLIHELGINDVVSYMYDIANARFADTREETPPLEIAEEFERILEEEFASQAKHLKGLKHPKISAALRDEIEAVAEQVEDAPQLGAKPKTLSQSLGVSAPQSNISPRSKADRLARLKVSIANKA